MLAAGGSDTGGTGERNHPLALRMAVIAFITNNVTLAAIFGPFSVLLTAVEARLGVGREASTLGLPALTLAMAVCAPVAGVLAARFSLRIIMLAGAIAQVAAFALLASTTSYAVYILAYALLLGPSMATGVILSATLVTRWFTAGRGLALGIATTPILIALLPVGTSFLLQSHDLTAIYWMLAALSLVPVVANLFTVDYPPQGERTGDAAGLHGGGGDEGSISVAALLGAARFWFIAIAAAISNAGIVILGAHAVPLAITWGYSATMAAGLQSIQSGVGMLGTILFGFVAGRIGGLRALLVIVLDGAILWAALLIQPPFPVLAVLIGLLGLHGAGVLPVLGLALSDAFGKENFSRAYGIANVVNLPFSVVAVPIAAMVYTQTGAYTGAILGEAALLAFATVLTLMALQRRGRTLAAA